MDNSFVDPMLNVLVDLKSPEDDMETVTETKTAPETVTETKTATETATETKVEPEIKGTIYEFNADIAQLMSLIINTFYSNKDIFLRELVSNASDALDKLRFLALSDPDVIKHQKETCIRISADVENKTLTITDTGIGMTKQDLIQHLGTIAKSGTKSFMDAMSKGNADFSMIGQFGVGFYSAYLVANRVVVTTKHNDDIQYSWASNANDSFTIFECDGTPLGRGTQITLFLKDDMLDYLKEDTLRRLLKRHAEFISFPIFLQVNKVVDVPNEETKKVEENDDKPTVTDVTEEVKTTAKKTIQDWEMVNSTKPLWRKKNNTVLSEEYQDFYKTLNPSDSKAYLAVKHFSVEGTMELNCLLYVPSVPPSDSFDANKKHTHIKLYVRRVFIMDDCKDLIPNWLSFVHGVVDSEDLPLNISRESLQENKLLVQIRKNLVKKCIEMMTDLSQDAEKYQPFYQAFQRFIKFGIYEDSTSRDKLAHLLRFHSSHDPLVQTSLAQYVERMKPEQKQIYYITGESVDIVSKSPFVEALKKRGLECLYLVDGIDEYMLQQFREFDGKMLVSTTKEKLDLGLTDSEKEEQKVTVAEYSGLTAFIKEVIGSSVVERVVISDRLVESPCVLVTATYSATANMQRLAKAQVLHTGTANITTQRILEINPHHDIIRELKARFDKDSAQDATLKRIVMLLYESTLLTSGFSLDAPHEFAKRIQNLVRMGLQLDEPAVVVQDTVFNSPETTEAKDTSEAKDTTEAKDATEESKSMEQVD